MDFVAVPSNIISTSTATIIGSSTGTNYSSTATTPSPSPSPLPSPSMAAPAAASASAPSSGSGCRYENQKRRDWNSFCRYLRDYRPAPLPLSRCTSATSSNSSATSTSLARPGPALSLECLSPREPALVRRQAWGSLDALIGRLRADYEEHGGKCKPEVKPFAARPVRIFLREVRDFQAKSRGISHDKKRIRMERRRRRPKQHKVASVAPS